MLVASVISGNYLPLARVLARSFLDHHPDGRVVVLVFDAPSEGLRSDEPFEVVTLDQLPIPARERRRMATIYNVVELATALKPFFLRHLVVDRGEPSATYLDSDIEVHAPLDDLDRLAREHSLVLTPHRLEPLAEGVPPIEFIFTRSGAYNLGFVSVSADAVPFLDWWSQRCRRDCIDAIPDGLFVDQRWVDLAATYFPHHVVRDPGCNVAYWNLDRRPVTFADPAAGPGGGFLAGGVPLRFFHFSGYNPDEPHMLTPYQGPRPWILLSEHPALQALCDRYGERLEQEGRSECRKLAYGYSAAANGMPLDGTMRRVFRQEVLLREEGVREDLGSVDELPDPFEPAEVDRFVELLRSPFPESDAPRVPRYLHALYRDRPDLQRSFPDLTGGGGNHFLWWVREMGHQEIGVPAELVPGPADIDPVEPGDDAPPPGRGVRLVGYVDAELGVGEAGRAFAAGLEAAAEPLVVVAEHETRSRQRAGAPRATPEATGTDVDLICVNADRLPSVLDRLGPAFRADRRPGRRRVGVWAWEVEDLPPGWIAAAEHLDEIWTYSRHAAGAIGRALADQGLEVPLHVVPPPVPERPASGRSRAELGLPQGVVFLFCFDFFSVVERKNPAGLVEAFRRAFPVPTDGGPQLVLKSINGAMRIPELERLRLQAAERPDVHVRDGYLDPADHQALVAACDAYVSLHRAEGFGYTMAEAMLRAKPVIATGYSGNLEFMDTGNSFLVDHELVPIGPGCEPYPAGSRWAEPDLDQAAALLRQVVDDPAAAAAVGEQARRDIRAHHSPAARAALLAERLRVAREAAAPPPPDPRPAPPPPPPPPSLTRRVARRLRLP